MVNMTDKRELENSVTRLVETYKVAINEAEKSDILTRAMVTRGIIDSSQGLANRLITHVHDSDAAVQKLTQFNTALRGKDYAGKAASLAKWGFAKVGITAGIALGLAWALIQLLFMMGEVASPAILRLITIPAVLAGLIKVLQSSYKELMKAGEYPTPAREILSRVVDPVEREVCVLIGINPPTRTFDRVEQGGALLISVIAFVFGSGVVWGIWNFLGG